MLTNSVVKSAKPKQKPYKLSDSGGLYLLVSKAGSKSWKWKYSYDGKERVLSIGNYPTISLKQARDQRDEARLSIRKGIEPLSVIRKQVEDASLTFGNIADEILEERVDLIEQQLAHVVRDPLGRAYNRTKFLPQRKVMMQRRITSMGSVSGSSLSADGRSSLRAGAGRVAEWGVRGGNYLTSAGYSGI